MNMTTHPAEQMDETIEVNAPELPHPHIPHAYYTVLCACGGAGDSLSRESGDS